MLVSNGVLLHRYQQRARDGMLTGRHLELDARSLAYTVEAQAPVPIRPAEHLPAIPTLDQSHLHAQGIHVDGDPDGLGSCTGNAGSAALSSGLGSGGLARAQLGAFGLSPSDSAANERFAIELYHRASLADSFPGDWPPADEGSSGLGVCRALKKAKLIVGYRWAVSRRGLGQLLQSGGGIIGMPWLEAFFEPDGSGFIDAAPGWADSGVAGGHELYIEALEAWDDRDPSKCVIRLHNSWTDSWGDHGCGRMRLSTYEFLKQQSDVKQLVA